MAITSAITFLISTGRSRPIGCVKNCIEESNADDEYDKHLLVVANLQRNTAHGLLGTLDTELHDDLTRLSDRVIRFKHLEDGIFI